MGVKSRPVPLPTHVAATEPALSPLAAQQATAQPKPEPVENTDMAITETALPVADTPSIPVQAGTDSERQARPPATSLGDVQPDAIAGDPPRPAQAVLEVAAGETPSAFEFWSQVLERMAAVDRMLYSYMQDTQAYTDGKRVLISGGDVFLTFMQNNAPARERIKTVIQQVSGQRYGIGPYKPAGQAAAKQVTTQDTLKQWSAMGVDVQYDNREE